MRFQLLGKSVAVGAIALLLLAALGSIDGVVSERQGRLREAQASVAEAMAGAQTLLGPVLQRTCTESWDEVVGEGKDRKTVSERRDFFLTAVARDIDIDATTAIEPRYRGIFKINTYALQARLRATWSNLSALRTPSPQARANRLAQRLSCDPPVLWIGVGDARGIRAATVKFAGLTLMPLPGTASTRRPHGIHVYLSDDIVDRSESVADISLELVGVEALTMSAVGETSRIRLASNWPHPSFGGRFLPADRTIDAKGFHAEWRLSALATEAPRQLIADAEQIESFGVTFIDPINPYVLCDRAIKYGLLFIVLTFVGVGLIEVLRRLRVHPIQYLLVGAALTIFFLLLVSLSEHLSFGPAYALASAGCTGLLAFYGSFVLRSARAGLGFGAAIGVLYGVLYVLLQMEQTALVLGSVLLFAVLAGVMVATRRVDWYALFDAMRRPAVNKT